MYTIIKFGMSVEEGSSIGYYVILEPRRLSFLDPCKAMKAYAPSPVRPGLGRHSVSNTPLNERSNSNTFGRFCMR